MVVLLVIADRALRSFLASVCVAALPSVRCIESENDVDSMILEGAEKVDIVVLDHRAQEEGKRARIANWRRMVPSAHVVMLGRDREAHEQLLREAILRLRTQG